MTLFQIGDEYRALRQILENDLEFDQETGEVVDNSLVFKQLFDELKASLDDKLNNYQRVIIELNGQIDTITREIKRLQNRKTAIANNIERMKEAMLGGISASGNTSVKTDFFTFHVRKSESVNIFDEDKLSRTFLRMKFEPDKNKIKDAIKKGETVEGARVVENISLTVK